MMQDYGIPEHLSDKIFEIKTNDDDSILKLISYFPLLNTEKDELRALFGSRFESGTFHSIFSDAITDEEWSHTKTQIKKRFNSELLDIDKTPST